MTKTTIAGTVAVTAAIVAGTVFLASDEPEPRGPEPDVFSATYSVVTPKNIVFLILDDADARHFSHPARHTPNMDRLILGGTTFRNCVAQPLCRPSLASMICGLDPREHTIYSNILPSGRFIDPAGTLPVVLRDAGYRTIVAGKWWEGTTDAGMSWTADPATYGWTHVGENRDDFVRVSQAQTLGHVQSAITADEPFFLWWAPFLPHTPHNPPQEYLDLINESLIEVPEYYSGDPAAYLAKEEDLLAMTAWFDDGLGELLDVLDTAGVTNDTLIVLLNDDGLPIGLPSKGSWFDAGVMTPLVFHWPGGINSGRAFDRLTPLVDLYPTILEYAGLPVPEGLPGESLAKFIHGQQVNEPEVIFGASYPAIAGAVETPGADAYVLWARTSRHKYARFLKPVDHANNQDPGFHWIEHVLAPFPTRSANTDDLFDLDADPYELTDISDTATEYRDYLRFRTEEWWGVAPPPPSTKQILDNGDSGFSVVGGWTYFANPPTPGYQFDVHYSEAGTGADKAVWTFTDLEPGTYSVSVTWTPNMNRATNAPYTVKDGTTVLGTLTINQELPPDDFTSGGSAWERIGDYGIQGTTLTVELSDDANDYVLADAVMIEKVD